MALRAETVGASKAQLPLLNLAALAVLAGAFIALGAAFFTTATTATDLGYGPTRLLGGVAFSLGLILVVIAGAELFTGNNLMVMAWAGGRIPTTALLRAWAVVYAGNFVGAAATAVLVALSGQWRFADQAVGANEVQIATAKVNLEVKRRFSSACCVTGWSAWRFG